MPEISFIFGPNSSFFFDCPQTWRFHEIPRTLRQLFNSTMSPQWRVASPYCLALAPQINSPEPVWYVGCQTLDGEDKLCMCFDGSNSALMDRMTDPPNSKLTHRANDIAVYSQTYFDINYPDLARWTKSFPNAARSCFVTFGQNLSYFACAPGHGSIWAGIPSELEDTVRNSLDTPCCVSLGMKNAWFVSYADGRVAWKFHGHYSALNKILINAEPGSVTYVAVSPYNKEHYFIAFRDRSIKYNFKGAPAEWMRLMTEVFDVWAAERLRVQQFAQSPPPQLRAYPPSQVYVPQQSPYLKSASPSLTTNPMSPPMTPGTPLPIYTSPVQQYAVPNATYANKLPQGEVLDVPAELPGDMLISGSASILGQSEIDHTKKKKRFFSKLF